MTVEKAVDIVYELANQNKLSGQEAEENEEEAKRQQQALDVIHDFVANDTFVVSFVNWRPWDFSFFAAPTFDELYSDMAELLREIWEEEFLGDTLEGEPPEDDKECVRLYFDEQSHRLDGDWYAADYLQLSEVME